MCVCILVDKNKIKFSSGFKILNELFTTIQVTIMASMVEYILSPMSLLVFCVVNMLPVLLCWHCCVSYIKKKQKNIVVGIMLMILASSCILNVSSELCAKLSVHVSCLV